MLVGCGGGGGTTPSGTEGGTQSGAQGEETPSSGKEVINLWAFTDEVPGMVDKFLAANPDFPYEVKTTIVATTDGAYQPALDQALAAGGEDAPDMYCAEAAFILKYSQGDASSYAAPYEDLGIDVATATSNAQIAQLSLIHI